MMEATRRHPRPVKRDVLVVGIVWEGWENYGILLVVGRRGDGEGNLSEVSETDVARGEHIPELDVEGDRAGRCADGTKEKEKESG
jgi:hypothetical protein